MKLTLKIVALFLIVACGLVGLNGYLAVQREVAFFETEVSARHEQLVVAIRPTLGDLWRSAGPGGSLEFLRYDGSERQVRTRWVWLDESADIATLPVVDRSLLIGIPQGTLTPIRYTTSEGLGLFCSYFPFSLSDGRLGALEIVESMVPRDEYTRDTILRTATLMIALVAGAGSIVGLFGVRLIGTPLQALIEKTRQVAAGNLLTPVSVRGNDELAMLATALNQMSDKLDESQKSVLKETNQRIEAMEQLRHGDRLKTLGRLASGVAHELGTPLNVISGRAGLIAGGKLDNQQVATSAETIQAEAKRMTTLVQQLLNFARRSAPKRVSSDINALIDRTLSMMQPIIANHQARVTFTDQVPSQTRAHVDPSQLQQVLSNLIMNAVQSRESDVHVQIAANLFEGASPDVVDGPSRQWVRISVIDNGVGIEEADRLHVFEPFFTTREVGKGTGLGLSIAHEIIAEHGGWMTVDSAVGKGSTFCVFLPSELQ